MNIPGQNISIAEAKVALVNLLLTELGDDHDVSTFLLDGQLYKLHIERVTDEAEIAAVFSDYARSEGDEHDK